MVMKQSFAVKQVPTSKAILCRIHIDGSNTCKPLDKQSSQHLVDRKGKLIPGDRKILVKVSHCPSRIGAQCNQLATKQLLGFPEGCYCIKGSVLNMREWPLGEWKPCCWPLAHLHPWDMTMYMSPLCQYWDSWWLRLLKDWPNLFTWLLSACSVVDYPGRRCYTTQSSLLMCRIPQISPLLLLQASLSLI